MQVERENIRQEQARILLTAQANERATNAPKNSTQLTELKFDVSPIKRIYGTARILNRLSKCKSLFYVISKIFK